MNDITRKIYAGLLSAIHDRSIGPGSPLPPETRLAEQFGTNRMNAHHAVKRLEDHGLVVRKKRVGTEVRQNIDYELVSRLLKEINRIVYVLYSSTPHWIHWNENSFTALEKEIAPAGYNIIYGMIPVDGTRADHHRILHEISAAGASALVIFPDAEDTAFLRHNNDLLLDFQMPVYMLNRSGETMAMDMVSFVSGDPFGDAAAVGTLLQRQGCRQVGMLNEASGTLFWGVKRYEGLALGLERGGNPTPPNFLGTKDGFAAAAQAIRQAQGDFVLVAVNNQYAAQFIDFAAQQGLRVPADYRLVSFDDNPLYRSYNLTSMAAPMERIGRLFGKLICDQSWLKEYRGKVSIKVNSELVFRETFSLKKS
jgi:DNA-binding LacI/PurR family transcriptional regulator